MACGPTTVAMLNCCGPVVEKNYGSYIGFAKMIVGAGGFDDAAFPGFPANPHYRRYLTVKQRLESRADANYWREATWTYFNPYPGYDVRAWTSSLPLPQGPTSTPSTITSGSNWGVDPAEFYAYPDLTISRSDNELVQGLTVTPEYPSGLWKWTVTLTDGIDIEADLALFRSECDTWPEDFIQTYPDPPMFDINTRPITTKRRSQEAWIDDSLQGFVTRYSGSKAALHRDYRLIGDAGVPNSAGAYPWTFPPISNVGAGVLPTYVTHETMIEVWRKLDAPFSTTPRCRYTTRTIHVLTDSPSGGPLDCIQESESSNKVVKPTYGTYPLDYTYDSGTGQTRTVVIPPDNEDPSIGTPACCDIAP